MVKLRDGLTALAALGLVTGGAASATTRPAQSLPLVSTQIGGASPARASDPVVQAGSLAGGGGSAALIVGLVTVLLAALLAGSGGDGGGPDSPG